MMGFSDPSTFFVGYSPSFLYPVRGLTWPMTDDPSFNTLGQRTQGSRLVMESNYQNPLHSFKLKYDVLYNDSDFLENPATDLQILYSFYAAMTGKFGQFLYKTREATVVHGALELPDTNGYVELTYSLGPFFNEPIQELNGATPTVYSVASGVFTDITTDCTFYAPASVAPYDGLVFTTSVDLSGKTLAWSGTWFYRVHFTDDSYTFTEFMYKLMNTGIGLEQIRI